MSKEAPSTWKEWAIQISTESDITKEDVVDLWHCGSLFSEVTEVTAGNSHTQ